MAATRWPALPANSTSAGCAWVLSAKSTHTVTLTTQIHPVITSTFIFFLLIYPPYKSPICSHTDSVGLFWLAADSSTAWMWMKRISGVTRRTEASGVPQSCSRLSNALYLSQSHHFFWDSDSTWTAPHYHLPLAVFWVWSGQQISLYLEAGSETLHNYISIQVSSKVNWNKLIIMKKHNNNHIL